MDFYNKYLKYKNKYLKLKYNMNGGMVEHIMNLKKIWFDYIANGDKTIEGRLYDDKRKQLNVGDIIKFTNGEDSFTKEITKLETFDSFSDAVTEENYKKLIPNANNRDEALKVYTDIYDSIIEKNNHTDGILLIYFN